jgi:hypothetical protein
MATESPKYPWEERLREVARRAEDDLRTLVTYINDEVVPDIRRNSSDALRSAAAELERLARTMDSTRTPPPPPAGSPPDA